MELSATASVDQGARTFDVIVYGANATYLPGTYTFSVDLIPDYVLQGTQTGRF